MELAEAILSSEKSLKQSLEDFLKESFSNNLPLSHAINHHRRVWEYAKEILIAARKQFDNQEKDFIDKLLVACYLHDTGMATDPGTDHGKHSRAICERFFQEMNLNPDNFQEVLQVIEKHDNKEYKAAPQKDQLLILLSAADDLDAFGYIGIYRFSEIYLMRKANPSEIGYLIQENAAGRFENFRKNFNTHKEIVLKHKKRYEILMDFFRKYNNQIVSYNFGKANPSGYCGIIEILTESLNKSEDSLKKFSIDSDDAVIKLFFSELEKEW